MYRWMFATFVANIFQNNVIDPPVSFTCICGILSTNSFRSRTVLAPWRSSNCADMAFAFLLSVGPTALKFLSLRSAKISSLEFRTNDFVLFITDVSPDSWLGLSNLSLGSLIHVLLISKHSSINPSYVSWVIKGEIRSTYKKV